MGEAYAYNDATTSFDHEVLFLLTSMDPIDPRSWPSRTASPRST